jgi:hypothetical protein
LSVQMRLIDQGVPYSSEATGGPRTLEMKRRSRHMERTTHREDIKIAIVVIRERGQGLRESLAGYEINTSQFRVQGRLVVPPRFWIHNMTPLSGLECQQTVPQMNVRLFRVFLELTALSNNLHACHCGSVEPGFTPPIAR